jgi:hypothetical protein
MGRDVAIWMLILALAVTLIAWIRAPPVLHH